MLTTFSLFSLLLLPLSLAQSPRPLRPCNPKCLLSFCAHPPPPASIFPLSPQPAPPYDIYLRPPLSLSTPLICRKNHFLTNLTIATYIRPDREGRFRLLTRHRPPGLFPRFRDDYFLPIAGEAGMGIGRRRSAGSQINFLNGCIRVVLTGWNGLNKRGRVRKRITPKSLAQCVSFRAVTSTILVELSYTSASEYDMLLFEPGAPPSELSALSTDPTPGGGIFVEKKNSTDPQMCGPIRMRRNTIVYDDNSVPPSGRYQVLVIKRDLCDGGADNGNLRFQMRYLLSDRPVVDGFKAMRGIGVGGTSAVFRFFRG